MFLVPIVISNFGAVYSVVDVRDQDGQLVNRSRVVEWIEEAWQPNASEAHNILLVVYSHT